MSRILARIEAAVMNALLGDADLYNVHRGGLPPRPAPVDLDRLIDPYLRRTP